MELQIPILLGAIAIVVVTFSSRRLGAPAPLLLVLVGVLVSFLPWVGEVKVEPELVLAGILPPLLYSGAVNIPAMGFRRDFRPIAGLSVLLVILTSIGVGLLFAWIVPGIGLPTGIALAAIVSPTDAVATTLVRRVGAPERVVTVLEGESLLNDASALVILRSAVAAIAGSVSFGWIALDFVWAVVAAVVIGFAVGQISLRLRSHLHDPVLNTAVSFVIPFVAYLPAEHLGASGLVAAVLAGLVFGQFAPAFLTPQERRSEEANWRTVEFLLEGSIFLLMGLELSGLLADVRDEGDSLARALWLGAVGLLAVLAVRAIYLSGLILGQRRERADLPGQREQLVSTRQRLDTEERPWSATAELKGIPRAIASKHNGRAVTPELFEQQRTRVRRYFDMRIADLDYLIAEPIGKREGALLVWAGMRGAVTLAAAQSLPRDTPQRDLLVLIAFVVAAGSLLIQGGTLPWLTRRLGVTASKGDGSERAERRALAQRLSALSSELCDDPTLMRANGSAFDAAVHQRVCQDGQAVSELLSDPSVSYEQYPELRIRILHAQRTLLLDLRDEGGYSAGALDDALAILDSDEIALAVRESAFEQRGE
ncbi:MAG TPA: sodium:proton antiporter [Thermomicrobiales bacterium]|nr:sodium:proton antiporter [Thermomicrobiales bacterium]